MWLQQNFIGPRKLNLLYSNRNGNLYDFSKSVSRPATFYLAKGINGAILGAITYVNIEGKHGFNSYGPGDTAIFSVTNKKIYHFGPQTFKPLVTLFEMG